MPSPAASAAGGGDPDPPVKKDRNLIKGLDNVNPDIKGCNLISGGDDVKVNPNPPGVKDLVKEGDDVAVNLNPPGVVKDRKLIVYTRNRLRAKGRMAGDGVKVNPNPPGVKDLVQEGDDVKVNPNPPGGVKDRKLLVYTRNRLRGRGRTGGDDVKANPNPLGVKDLVQEGDDVQVNPNLPGSVKVKTNPAPPGVEERKIAVYVRNRLKVKGRKGRGDVKASPAPVGELNGTNSVAISAEAEKVGECKVADSMVHGPGDGEPDLICVDQNLRGDSKVQKCEIHMVKDTTCKENPSQGIRNSRYKLRQTPQRLAALQSMLTAPAQGSNLNLRVTAGQEPSETSTSTSALLRQDVAIIYDEGMLNHRNPSGEHAEKPERIQSILEKLHKEGLLQRCKVYDADLASVDCLLSVHTHKHVTKIMNISSKSKKIRDRLASSYSANGDIYFSEGSSKAALLAAGAVNKACTLVADGVHRSCFAIVRPPGHHSNKDSAAGFCLFNNVAVGASTLLEKYGMEKVLILDWDVHHGNGTQDIFFDDDRVLFFSIHRFNNGDFFPCGKSGSVDNVGIGKGKGYNINVGWNHNPGDADYFAVWTHLLLPLLKEYKPEIILVSAGFDAAIGDELGLCKVTPQGFGILLSKLTGIAPIVMALEGGYNLTATADSVSECIKVLLGNNITTFPDPDPDKRNVPYKSTWKIIRSVRKKLSQYWPTFKQKVPEDLAWDLHA